MVMNLFFDFIRADIIFGFDVVEFLLFFFNVQSLKCFVGLIVEHHQITIANVESRQMVAGIFGVKDIFIYNKSCTSGLGCVATVMHMQFCSIY